MKIDRRNLLWATVWPSHDEVGRTSLKSDRAWPAQMNFYGIRSPDRSSTEPGELAWSTGELIRL